MKHKLYVIALVAALVTLLAAVPVWAKTSGISPQAESNVTVNINVNEVIGIDVPVTTVAFTIDGTVLAGALPAYINPSSGSPITIGYFYNKNGNWWFCANASAATFSGSTIPVSRLEHSATAISGSPVVFGYGALSNANTQYFTSATKTTGWETSSVVYRLRVFGDEPAGGPYSTTLTYTMQTTAP